MRIDSPPDGLRIRDRFAVHIVHQESTLVDGSLHPERVGGQKYRERGNIWASTVFLFHEEMTVDRLLALCDRVLDNYTEVEAAIAEGINLRNQYTLDETARLLTDICRCDQGRR